MEKHNKLDVAAKLFPSVTSKKNSYVFRISIVLKESIDPRCLQIAVNMAYERFALFFLRLRRGVFWNYFDKNDMHFTALKETNSPCENILPNENKGYIIKVLYHHNRISVEAFHSIADGNGIIEFLKSLTYYYICIKNRTIDAQGEILLYDGINEQADDSYIAHFRKIDGKIVKKSKVKSAFLIKGKRYKKKGNCVINGVASVDALKKYCKSYDCTITTLLVAIMISAIYQSKQKATKSKKPIVVSIPVNLRSLFPSTTLRNFAGVVNVDYKMSDDTNFVTLITSVKLQLKALLTQANLSGDSAKNVQLSENMFVTNTPLVFKNMIFPISHTFIGERNRTITMSNIGKIDLPEEIKPHVEHLEFVLYPTEKRPLNCAICSYEDKLVISFTKSITDTHVVREFFKTLIDVTNTEVCVYSNGWGEEYEKM